MLALMGPSGSGKTTLLDVLSGVYVLPNEHFCLCYFIGRATQGTLSKESTILVNGKPRTKKFKRISGYVMQDDALLGSLTVKETLMCTGMSFLSDDSVPLIPLQQNCDYHRL
jgi:ABC-type multidrug transport system ATPase subunit